MPDDADMSDKQIEDAILHGIEAARIQAQKPKIHYVFCDWCDTPTDNGIRFCDHDCASDYAAWEAAQARSGR